LTSNSVEEGKHIFKIFETYIRRSHHIRKIIRQELNFHPIHPFCSSSMEDDSTPPALSPAISSGSSPEALSCIDFEMYEQDPTTSTSDMGILEPLYAFVASEDSRRMSSSSPSVRVVKEWDPDALDGILIEADPEDMCFCDDDLALDRRLMSLGCPDNTSAS
jgi:hypothetical protein